MWNERYNCDEYVYGTKPNDFLAENACRLKGPALMVAEGEGRNIVFLASLGIEALGIDGSEVGLAKAHRLADEKGVSIRTEVADLEFYEPPSGHFNSAVSIFAHLPSPMRIRLHKKIAEALNPGGIILVEAYSKAQIEKNTGGPKNPDMLMSLADLKADFEGFRIIMGHEIERQVIEGDLHSGIASVVQFIAQKNGKKQGLSNF